MDVDETCSICETALHNGKDKVVAVQRKGLGTLISRSQELNDDKWKQWVDMPSENFHEYCRKRYPALPLKRKSLDVIEEASITDFDRHSEEASSSRISNTSTTFDFKKMCFFCGQSLDRYRKKVCTLTKSNTLRRFVDIGSQDEDYYADVLERLRCLEEKKNYNAFYHQKCSVTFTSNNTKKEVNNQEAQEMEVQKCFKDVCSFIEQSGQFQFNLSDLQGIMTVNLSNYILFKKLKEKYGKEIFIKQNRGKRTVIYYKTFDVSQICADWFCDEDSVDDSQKKTILNVAAKILRREVENFKYRNDYYTPSSTFLDNISSDVPPLLNTFLCNLLLKDNMSKDNFIERDNIAHSIVSIIRPNVFTSNLQLAVGTYVHRKTGSRLIVDLLSKLGVGASYYNLQMYEASTIMNPPQIRLEDTFVQYIYDNTDHNVATIDGLNTFHCLGGIAVYTPSTSIHYEGGCQKLKKMPTSEMLAAKKQIPTYPFESNSSNCLDNLSFIDTNLLELGSLPFTSPFYVGYLLGKSLVPDFPTWKGFMEVTSIERSYETSHIICLPFINEPPSKLSTLNTALQFTKAETARTKQRIAILTFDQPLYWKTRSLVKENEKVLIRLGGFHLLMSYLGAIGFVMGGSGLEDLWSTIYAPESVKKMMTGHAFSRALRAHILGFTAIGMVIIDKLNISEVFKTELEFFFQSWSTEPPQMERFKANKEIKTLSEDFTNKLHDLEQEGPTSKLWVQYFRCVHTVLQFLEAERLGDYKLHLQTIQNMLPLFHAAGHFAYAKSAQLYLQDLSRLELIMDPVEFDKFTTEGFFSIRRTDKAFSGVSPDMVIEQTLNRFFGTDLKHGRGVTPSVIARYFQGMPDAVNVMESLENYCNLKSISSEQHTDLTRSRIKRDNADINKLVFWLKEHNPFEMRNSLMSLSTGIIGGSNINCHQANELGLQGMSSMVGKPITNTSLSQVHKVKPLGYALSGSSAQNEKFFMVDSELIFNRIAVIFQGNEEKTREALCYDLSPYPLAFFDENGWMRKTPKSELYKILRPTLQSPELLRSFTYVVDGGWLLHRIVWPHSKTFREIFQIYYEYITRYYGQDAIVVFDGYNNEIIGIKSYERYRRKEKSVAADVEISINNLVCSHQSKFLANTANKFKFVQLLATFLKQRNIDTKIASEDADCLIVTTAIDLSLKTEKHVAMVGNDVDLLVLAIGLTSEINNLYFLKISQGKKSHELYSTRDNKDFKKYILFAHAFGGCDTTSAIYKKGKKTIFQFLEKNPNLQEVVQIFYNENSSIEEVFQAAQQIILHLYKSKSLNNLSINDMRYNMYRTLSLTSKKKELLATLPPTESALREHAKRVYCQVQQWLGNEIKPEEWGWQRTNKMMIPVKTDKPPAPEELLELIFCSCNGNCSTGRCSCKKAGLQCNFACKICNGESCDNASKNKQTIEIDDVDIPGETVEVIDFEIGDGMEDE